MMKIVADVVEFVSVAGDIADEDRIPLSRLFKKDPSNANIFLALKGNPKAQAEFVRGMLAEVAGMVVVAVSVIE